MSPAGLLSNRFFLYAVGGSLGGQLAVIYLSPLQAVFQTVPLSLSDWAYILSIASTVLVVDELRKALSHARSANQAVLPAVFSRLFGRGKKRLRYGYARITGGAQAVAADEYKRTDVGAQCSTGSGTAPTTLPQQRRV